MPLGILIAVFQVFRTGENDPAINSFFKCHMSLVKIKDFNALLDNKPSFLNNP